MSEWALSGLTPQPPFSWGGQGPPRVGESAFVVECELQDKLDIRNDDGDVTTTIIVGRIRCYVLNEGAFVACACACACAGLGLDGERLVSDSARERAARFCPSRADHVLCFRAAHFCLSPWKGLRDADGSIAPGSLLPVSRGGGITYLRSTSGFDIPRPRWAKEAERPEVQHRMEAGQEAKR